MPSDSRLRNQVSLWSFWSRTQMFIRHPSGDGDLVTECDLRSVVRSTLDGSTGMRRRHFVHMYLPAPLLPFFVFVVGRRQCCGARRGSTHLVGCHRHPWSSRRGECSPSLDATTR